MSANLQNIATLVGYEVVNVDDGFTNYEYHQKLASFESLSYLITIKDELSFDEMKITLYAIIDVLPKGLKKKIYKLTKKFDKNNKQNILDLVYYTIEEYKMKTPYQKLYEYGQLVGVDLEKHNYFFDYDLSKKEQKQILALIESSLPLELAPVLGKIKKIDYKIGFMKNRNRFLEKDNG